MELLAEAWLILYQARRATGLARLQPMSPSAVLSSCTEGHREVTASNSWQEQARKPPSGESRAGEGRSETQQRTERRSVLPAGRGEQQQPLRIYGQNVLRTRGPGSGAEQAGPRAGVLPSVRVPRSPGAASSLPCPYPNRLSEVLPCPHFWAKSPREHPRLWDPPS